MTTYQPYLEPPDFIPEEFFYINLKKLKKLKKLN